MPKSSCAAEVVHDITSHTLLQERQVEWHYIAPGWPTRNSFLESLMPAWRNDYETVRPNSKLGGKRSANIAGERAWEHAPSHVAIRSNNHHKAARPYHCAVIIWGARQLGQGSKFSPHSYEKAASEVIVFGQAIFAFCVATYP